MSINPVPNIEPVDEAQFAQRKADARPAAGEINAIASISGTSPKQKTPPAQNTTISTELPEDEVQVQRDSSTDNDIVVTYVNHAGNVILQVPSSEVLNVARGINQDLERLENAAKTRAGTTETSPAGGENRGH